MNSQPDPIYLDHNATTPLLPEVVDAMLPFLRNHWGNPSSAHPYGRRALDAVEKAREETAALLGCQPDEVIFTSGGTEANNLALRGVMESAHSRGHLVTSMVEHPATTNPCSVLQRHGCEITKLPVDSCCRIEPDDAIRSIRNDTVLFTIIHANNEVGTIQPIADIAAAAHEQGVLIHTDAAQSVGKIPTKVNELGVDLLSLAGHKLYAPKGIGALYVRRSTRISPLLVGASQERGLRPGTENVPAIAGLGRACTFALADMEKESKRIRSLRDSLWDRLCASVKGISLNGHPTERLPNTLNVSFPLVRGGDVLRLAPSVAASTGSACHDRGETPSAVLTAMGIDMETALGSVRISLGRGTTAHDIEKAAQALSSAWQTAAGVNK